MRTNQISRRDFSKALSRGLAGGAMIRGPLLYGMAEMYADGLAYSKMSAPEYVEAFPKQISGASSVEIPCRTPGSKYALVQVMQVHPAPNMTDEQAAGVEQVQLEIYKILSELLGKKAIPNKVYCENVYPKIEADIRRCRQSELMAARSEPNGGLDSLMGSTAFSATDVARIKKVIEKKYGGAGRLWNEGKLQIVSAETEEGYEAAKRAAEKYDGHPEMTIAPADFRVVYTDRHNILLDQVRRNKDRHALTVLGGSHNLTEDINIWNNERPNDPLSYIRVMPETYEELRKRGEVDRVVVV